MESLQAIIIFLSGAIISSLLLWRLTRVRISAAVEKAQAESAASQAALQAQHQSQTREMESLKTDYREAQDEIRDLLTKLQRESEERATLKAQLDNERQATKEKLDLLNEARQKLSDAFNSLSADALKSNNESFLQLAKSALEKFQENAQGDLSSRQKAIEEIVTPVRDTLQKMDEKLQELERKRVESHSTLSEQIRNLASTETELKNETSKLAQALRAPVVRGRWGEIQLRRVVEMAGMLPYCDFEEQVCSSTDDGRLQPDMVVRLPNSKNIIVDAKTPLEAYLSAIEVNSEEERNRLMEVHARQVREHIKKLSSKAYWDQFQPTPEFVTMFLPGEHFFGAALEVDPHLIEEGVSHRVILASPTTLIALLRAVAYGWQQEQIAESAQVISNLGKEMYDRLVIFTEHLNKVGRNLDSAIESYNRAVGSLESRVMVSARKFSDLGIATRKELPEIKQSEKTPREIVAPQADSGTFPETAP